MTEGRNLSGGYCTKHLRGELLSCVVATDVVGKCLGSRFWICGKEGKRSETVKWSAFGRTHPIAFPSYA